MKAVILAGGKGTRLKPFTEALPKPMLPIGVKPLLEIVIEYLKKYEFEEVILAINYRKESIIHYFSDGKRFGIKTTYSIEKSPLGTAGAVKKAAININNTFVVVLGDVLADIDYHALTKYHKEMNAAGTMVIFEKTIKIPYGVLNLDIDTRNLIIGLEEKPELTFPVYAGIVVLEPRALNYVKDKEFLHMPDLFLRLKANNEKIVAYHHKGNWVDIGQDIEQYLKVNQEIMRKNIKFNHILSEIIFEKPL